MVGEAGKDIPGKGIGMLRGEMSPGVFLAGKIIIVNIGIGLYTPQRVFMSITSFLFSQQSCELR